MLLCSIHLLALSAGVVWAQQAPLRSKGSCLSSSNPNTAAALSLCCPTQDTEGKGTVDGTVFTYACGKWAKSSENVAQNSGSPRDCAQLCAQDPTCVAASWNSRGCYVIREGTAFETFPDQTGKFILLAKSEEPPFDDPSAADPAAIAQCNNEKDAIRREMTNQCEMEVQGQKAAHQGALRQAEERCKEEKAQCEADKSRQVTAAREQCDSDKAALRRDRDTCEAEKREKVQQGAAAEKQCKSQVDDLQKQVKDLEDKVRSGSGSGSGGTSTGTGSGSGSGSGTGGFVQTGDPACEKISTYSHCKPGCKNFAIDGVKYELRCNTFAERTEKARLNAYATINECLANKCNKEADCLGVSWTPDGACVFHYPKRAGLAANIVPKGGNWHHVMKLSS
ncbi:pan domain-containing protein [Colletotrichum chrysophilum]|uniref:Pan domain-containing protein n=1 Tax=Colletotrichum chrysophilum TaxID=1836956 RepID=A0AAD9AK43_9PEZI|nr:pan domain-containing protein [Colletotrichum chrysophilum]